MVFSVCGRGDAHSFFKTGTKIVLISITALYADLFQRQIGGCKIAAGSVNPPGSDQIADADFLCLFK